MVAAEIGVGLVGEDARGAALPAPRAGVGGRLERAQMAATGARDRRPTIFAGELCDMDASVSNAPALGD